MGKLKYVHIKKLNINRVGEKQFPRLIQPPSPLGNLFDASNLKI